MTTDSQPDPTNPAWKEMAEDVLESNRSFAALARDSELETVKFKDAPIDLRTIPREQWDQYIDYQVTLPPEVAGYLEGRDKSELPMKKEEVHALEIALEKWHDVAEPYYISMCATLQSKGRAWAYVEVAAPYLTGFLFGKID